MSNEIVWYNREQTIAVMEAELQSSFQQNMSAFATEVAKQLHLEAGQQLHIFVCPTMEMGTPEYTPYENPQQERNYRNDGIHGALWIEVNGQIKEYFPYSVWFSARSVSFDAGPPEDPYEAATIVKEVMRENNHIGVTSMTTPRDLVREFILPLLPQASRLAA